MANITVKGGLPSSNDYYVGQPILTFRTLETTLNSFESTSAFGHRTTLTQQGEDTILRQQFLRESEASNFSFGPITVPNLALSQFLLTTGLTGGNYTVSVEADYLNEVAETDETDNVISKNITIFDSVELELNDYAFSETSVEQGGTLDVAIELFNTLDDYEQDISDYVVRLVASENATYSVTDQILYSFELGDIGYEGSGTYIADLQDVVLPESLGAGAWYLALILDPHDNFVEVNNLSADGLYNHPTIELGQIEVLPAPAYDLQVVGGTMQTPANEIRDGAKIEFVVDLQNAGTQGTIEQEFVVSLDLYRSGFFITKLESFDFGDDLAAGAFGAITLTATLTQGVTELPAGDYQLLAEVDSADEVAETDETNNSLSFDLTILPPAATAPETGGTSDFDANGVDDILFFNDSTNSVGQFQMPDGAWKGIGTAGNGWEAVGTGLFSGDNFDTDILWFNQSSGNVGFYEMDDGANAGWRGLAKAGSGWEAAGTGDFDGNGLSDVLWYNASTGKVGQHSVSASGSSWKGVGSTGSGWEVAAVEDLNADGIADILWHNATTGGLGQFRMAADGSKQWVSLGTMGTGWEVVGTGDFWPGEDSGLTDYNDVLVFNETTGALGHFDLYLSDGASAFTSVWNTMGTAGQGWSVEGTGDFDGNGVTDILWRHDDGRMGQYSMNDPDDWDWVALANAGTAWDVII